MEKFLTSVLRRFSDDRLTLPDKLAIATQNDRIITAGSAELAELAKDILRRLDISSIIAGVPSIHFAEYLLKRTPENLNCIVPRDSESITSLHDIPIIRNKDIDHNLAELVSERLKKRKGCIVEGLGIITSGSMTLEQAYINWSSLFHASYIKYLEEVLAHGFLLSNEKELLENFCDNWLLELNCDQLEFNDIPLTNQDSIMAEMCRVGRYTVQLGLVDSFFGNISYISDNEILISQTSSRLDRLEGAIDPVPFDGSSTAGITASSELPAHRAIAEATGCRTILHGHPKFPVVMGFQANKSSFDEIEEISGIPVVGGEGGQGGLAESLPRAFKLTGANAVIAKGHGVFSIGSGNYRDAFKALVDVELKCRSEFFRTLKKRTCQT